MNNALGCERISSLDMSDDAEIRQSPLSFVFFFGESHNAAQPKEKKKNREKEKKKKKRKKEKKKKRKKEKKM